MAAEYGVTNQQNDVSLLGANEAGTETRRLEVTDDGRLKVDVDGDINVGNVGLVNTSEVEINPSTEDTLQKLIGFDISPYDYLALTYVSAGNGAGEIETVVYKTGGVGGTTVATLTLAYNISDEISSITKT